MINRNKITPETCRQHPEIVFVFGDNLIQKGKAGQACIRDEPNAFGIPTKRLPSMSEHAFFSDQPDELCAVVQSLTFLLGLSESRRIVFPMELGTGLAKMPEKSPKIHEFLVDSVEEHFDQEINK